jgi:AAA domain
MKSSKDEYTVAGARNVRPELRHGAHPVETDRCILVTPMIEALETEIMRWIINRVSGGMVVGEPRRGKTRAKRYLNIVIPQRIAGLPVLSFRCHKHIRLNERVFFARLLDCTNAPDPDKGTPGGMRSSLTDRLCDLAERADCNQVVFLADEAQRLQDLDYQWLMDIHNELDERDINLSVILFGQPELLHQRSAFQQAGKKQILGRFMTRDFAFHGLIDLEDVKHCLNSYDLASEYPAGSGYSFTRYFFPEAFDAGWRLASHAEDIWQEFMAVTTEYAVSRYEEIPMLHFANTVKGILTSIGPASGASVKISRQQIHELIMDSGYAEFRKKGEGKVGENTEGSNEA